MVFIVNIIAIFLNFNNIIQVIANFITFQQVNIFVKLEPTIDNCYYNEHFLEQCFITKLHIGFILIAIREISISFFERRAFMSNIVDFMALHTHHIFLLGILNKLLRVIHRI
jgi:hypothetical protein